MNVHEEVYTSAVELLDRASGNLGIVAQTRRFPAGIEAELQSHRAYQLMAELPINNPAIHPPRYVVGPSRTEQGAHFIVTRVGFAGADHTGRTTPLAHHLVLARQELIDSQTPAWQAIGTLSGRLRVSWNQPPLWIDPPAELEQQPTPTQLPELCRKAVPGLIAEIDMPEALIAVADGLVRFPLSRQPVLVVLPKNQAGHVLELLMDVLSLLPISLQYRVVAVSHVIESSDYLRDAWLVFTYPGTPFLNEVRQRRDAERPQVIDLSAGVAATPSANGYATVIRAQWQGGRSAQVLDVCRLWDRLGLEPPDTKLFSQAVELRHQMSTIASAAGLESLASDFAKLRAALSKVELLDRWCVSMVNDRLNKLPPAQRWPALASVSCATAWPAAAREAAWRAIAAEPLVSLRELPETVMANPVFQRALGSLIAKNPRLVVAAVAQAVDDRSPASGKIALLLLELSTCSYTDQLEIAEPLVTCPGEVAEPLLAAVVAQLACQPLTPRQLEDLDGRAARDVSGRWWTRVTAPVFRRLFATGSRESSEFVGKRLIEHGMKFDSALADASAMIDQHRGRVTETLVEQWLQQTSATAVHEPLNMLLRQARLLPRTATDPASEPLPKLRAAPHGFEGHGLEVHGHNRRPAHQARQFFGSAGPIVPPLILASVLGIFWLVMWFYYTAHQEVAGYLLWPLGLAAGVYVVVEVLLRILFRNTAHLSVPWWLRWAMTLLLIGAVGYAGYIVSIESPGLSKWVMDNIGQTDAPPSADTESSREPTETMKRAVDKATRAVE